MNSSPSPNSLLRSLKTARAARNLDEVVRLAEGVVQRVPDNVLSLRVLARTFSELGRDDAAFAHWSALSVLNPADIEAAFNVARHLVAKGAQIPKAVAEAAPRANAIFRRHIEDSLQSPLPSDVENFQHVAICGVSFCGSTLLDRILGGLSNVRSIGESHWLTKEHDGENYVPMDLAKERPGKGPFCTVCGKNCKFLTTEFRTRLLVDPTRWYQKIARQLETSILISADKNAAKLIDNDPLLRFSSLVLFKSPEQAWASQRIKLPTGRDARFYDDELAKYLDVWVASYRTFLDELRPEGKQVFLLFDDFSRDPEPLLRAACLGLKLPYDASVLVKTRPGHAIGGNRGAMARLRVVDYGVKIDPLPAADILPKEITFIANQKSVQYCFGELMSRYAPVAQARRQPVH